MAPGKGCHTHCSVFKGFNNRGYRVQHHNPLFVRRDGAQGIDHRGGIHPQLHDKAEQKGEVAVFGGHRRNQDTETQSESGEHQDQHRNQQDVNRGTDLYTHRQIVNVNRDKQQKLDAHPHQVGTHRGQRHHQPWKINFSENMLVGGKCRRGLVQTVGKVLPANNPCQIEERLGEAVGGDLRNPSKHHHIHYCRKRRLDKIPQRPQDGLFVLGDDVTPYKHRPEVAVLPDLGKVDMQELVLGLDYCGPGFFHINNVQGFKGSRVQWFKGSRVQRFNGSRVQRFKGSKVVPSHQND